MNKPVAIDLFAGAGGLSLGLEDAGFRVAAALENDDAAASTYRRNLRHPILQADIRLVDSESLLATAGLQPGECALVAGGPPCQGFSLQRRGPRKDVRNGLVLEFIRIVEAVGPVFFLMENVGGLLTRHGAPFLRELFARMGDDGYDVSVRQLNAVEYEVPQQRKRAFIVGRKRTLPNQFRWPRGNPRADTWITVRDAIGDLPSPPSDGSPHADIANHFREGRLSALNLERIRTVPPGGGRLDLPEHLQLECHRNNPSHRHLDVYGRLAWDRPAGTLTARFDSFTRGRFAHPEEHRTITLREGARLQTFPDNFVFEGSREEIARQIGNAVPPLLAKRIGEAVMATLLGAKEASTSIIEEQYSFV